MHKLVPIGRFSQLTGLSIKALRLYDERGLLRPAVVDFTSGFRYYSLDQAPFARRIQSLRALQMLLADILALLNAENADVASQRLARHERWLKERIAGHQQMLQLLHAMQRGNGNSIEKEAGVKRKAYQCSFCGKDQGAVERLIAGPNGVFICDECVALCHEILDPTMKAPAQASSRNE